MAKEQSKRVALDSPIDDEQNEFVEQAEYIEKQKFIEVNAEHPHGNMIIRKLVSGGAKLLVGPRGCGKTTLMLNAYYSTIRDKASKVLPVYVNFKFSLKLEPLYVGTPNASYWFRQWLNLKIYEGILRAAAEIEGIQISESFPSFISIKRVIDALEAGDKLALKAVDDFNTESLSRHINEVLNANGYSRCILLLDDAAHAFSPKQQGDFFEFFREIRSREIAPKAAIYPGITMFNPTFHVGHDAEQIDVWVKPDAREYVTFMKTLASNHFRGIPATSLLSMPEAVEFLAFASFGIPRSFLYMIRLLLNDPSSKKSGFDRRQLLDIAKESKMLAHSVYDSLYYKIPAFREFVSVGNEIYDRIIAVVKDFNKNKDESAQALEFGLKKPIPPQIEKVISFFQYAGLVMPAGSNSRGEKGSFEIYLLHYGDLITENAVIGKKSKNISSFVAAFTSQSHQAWPRISPDFLVKPEQYSVKFKLSLPHCQKCGAERINQSARFCHNCGAQLKTSSIYDELTNQDISKLPLSSTMVNRIKNNSTIRTVKDILIDSSRDTLRGIRYIGPVRASNIISYAEEHVA